MKCEFIWPNGNPCGCWSLDNSDFCYQHEPKLEKERLAIAHNRGVRQKRKLPFIQLAEYAFDLWHNMNPIRP